MVAKSRTATPPPATSRAAEKAVPSKEPAKEFGGAPGAVFIMVSSHLLLFLMTASLYGSSLSLYAPTPKTLLWVLGYHLSQYLCARFMPGVEVPGQTGLGYLCNGYSTLWATMAGVGSLHAAGVLDLTDLVHEFPAFLSTVIIIANIYAVYWHFTYAVEGGRFKEDFFDVYKFFIGLGVHPRFGIVDVKMVAETRISWTLLFLLTLGSYIEAARRLDTWLNPVGFMVLAHGLYANACAKGEHFIPYTWDITTEAFGWMLCWWNVAGVPMLYCYQSLFLAHHAWSGLVVPMPAIYYPVITALLVGAYCIWDQANYHKCYFKMYMRGDIIKRRLFPTFPHVEEPKYIKCDAGVLLIDGWYGWARKIHYTADTSMALLWGLSCGFSSPLPYVYFGFFVAMITHRAGRDEERCRHKYGETWDKYLKAVPYRFIPGVY